MTTAHAHHHHDDHTHAGKKSEHFLGFPYWHFIDAGTHLLRADIKPISRVLPAFLKVSRALPVVGVLGEAAHVYTPFQAARADWRAGRISSKTFGGLTVGYAVYALSGWLGGASVVAKEGLTYAVQWFDLMDEKYVPHSIYSELKHTGVAKGLPDMQGALKEYCPKCGGFHVGPAHHDEERFAPFPFKKQMREHFNRRTNACDH